MVGGSVKLQSFENQATTDIIKQPLFEKLDLFERRFWGDWVWTYKH